MAPKLAGLIVYSVCILAYLCTFVSAYTLASSPNTVLGNPVLLFRGVRRVPAADVAAVVLVVWNKTITAAGCVMWLQPSTVMAWSSKA